LLLLLLLFWSKKPIPVEGVGSAAAS